MESLDDIFLNAREMADPAQRAAYLAQACGGDTVLRARVESMLRDAEGAEAFFGKDGSVVVVPLTERAGMTIGRYKLLQKIGEGGMGVVYMAEQREPVVRKVALKIIKLGMDTRQVIARFEAERQALALMDHPNIAKVLDAGATETGRPYFVMDLVQGLPITQFCDEANLSTRERLELFITVCGAIQHAHQKGIIHRDIKPTNVLVTLNSDGSGHPVVIDFGVAKAISQRLTEKTLFTHFAQMIGTPAYMSPEQAEMSKLDVDTRSDVYSLGVLLYELLTGTTPFPEERLRNAGYVEMQRIICEEEPLRPSTRLSTLSQEDRAAIAQQRKVDPARLGLLLRGDLDWMLMKALEKDRTRRYDTASGLAIDIQRHIKNEPILARPPRKLYLFQKLVRRNKLAFAAGAAVAAAVIVGLGLSSWLFLRERVAAKAAAENALRAEQNVQESRRNLYAADMILGQAALEAGNFGRAKELLSKYLLKRGEEDLRGWEWRYAWNQCRSDELFTLEGHGMNVTSLALASNGITLASGSLDRTVKLWDLTTKKAIRELVQSDSVYGLSFSPDGKQLIVGTKDGQVAFWDCGTWLQTGVLRDLSWVLSVAVSPDGKMLAVFGIRLLTLFDLATRQEIARFEIRRTTDLAPGGTAFSADSSMLAYSRGDGGIVLLDLASRKTIAELEGHTRYVSVLAFSPDRSLLVSGSRDRTARVWEVSSGRLIKELGDFAGWVSCLAFSPDGELLAMTGSGQQVLLLETNSWEEVNTLRGHSEEVWATVFARDGRTLLTGAKDLTIKCWAVATNQQPVSRRLPPDVSSAFLVPDAKHLYLTHTNETYSLWSTYPFRELERHPITVPDRVFSRVSTDGKLWVAASSNGMVTAVDHSKVRVVSDVLGPWTSGYRVGFNLSPDGQSLVGIGNDQMCRVWRLAPAAPNSNDSRHVAPEAGFKEIARFETSVRSLSALKFLGDGQLVAIGDWAGATEIWDIGLTQKVATLRGHKWSIQDVILSWNGRTVVTSSGDGRVKLWDLSSQREIATLGGPLNTCFSVAFSPDETRIAACSGDGTVKLWDVETKQEVASLKIHNYILRQLAFSQDDKSLVVLAGGFAGQGGRLFVLRAPQSN